MNRARNRVNTAGVNSSLTPIESVRDTDGVWWERCLCVCGAETMVRRDHLRGGVIRSCGCSHGALRTTLVGRARGPVRVVAEAPWPGTTVTVDCAACGARSEVERQEALQILRAHRRGCPVCARRPQPIARGQRYGSLVVEALVAGSVWRCRCDCGAARDCEGRYLRAGRVLACSNCARKSRAKEVKQ